MNQFSLTQRLLKVGPQVNPNVNDYIAVNFQA